MAAASTGGPGPVAAFGATVRRSLAWTARTRTARWRSLPTTVIVGAARSGTTALFDRLATHPEVAEAFRKEVHYFDVHHDRGPAWYRANFPLAARAGRHRAVLEATPAYLAHPLVPGRMHDVLPEARLIALLREPVARAHSQWRLRVNTGLETRTFAEAVQDELRHIDRPDAAHLEVVGRTSYNHDAYVRRSLYARQLARWFEVFGRDRVFVCFSEELWVDAAVREELRAFMGLSTPVARLDKVHHQQGTGLDRGLAADLAAFFAPYNDALVELLDLDELPWRSTHDVGG